MNNGVLGSLASCSTAASGPVNMQKYDGYGPNYYALTFEITFKRKYLFNDLTFCIDDNDTVFFSHCYPFTYTD